MAGDGWSGTRASALVDGAVLIRRALIGAPPAFDHSGGGGEDDLCLPAAAPLDEAGFGLGRDFLSSNDSFLG